MFVAHARQLRAVNRFMNWVDHRKVADVDVWPITSPDPPEMLAHDVLLFFESDTLPEWVAADRRAWNLDQLGQPPEPKRIYADAAWWRPRLNKRTKPDSLPINYAPKSPNAYLRKVDVRNWSAPETHKTRGGVDGLPPENVFATLFPYSKHRADAAQQLLEDLCEVARALSKPSAAGYHVE
jgi:hypothetical protein